MPGQPPRKRTWAEVIVLVGAGLVAVGCVATVLTLAPLLLDADPLPVAFYLLCFLGPIGLALILVGLWRSARARTRQLQRAGEGLPPRLPG